MEEATAELVYGSMEDPAAMPGRHHASRMAGWDYASETKEEAKALPDTASRNMAGEGTPWKDFI